MTQTPRAALGLVVAMMAAALFAGCSEPVKPFVDGSTIEYISKPKGYYWVENLVTDATGANLTHADLTGADAKAASFVEQMMPFEGSNPNVALSKGAVLVTTFDRLQRSEDGGRNWTTAHLLLTDDFPKRQDKWLSSDNLVHVDPKTNRVFLFQYYGCASLYWSDNDGKDWTEEDLSDPSNGDTPFSCYSTEGGLPGMWHPKMVTAEYAAGLYPPQELKKYSRVLYVCGAENFLTPWSVICSTSYDSGQTWHTASVAHEALAPSLLQPDINDGCWIYNLGRGDSYNDGHVIFPVYRRLPNMGLEESCRPGIIESKDNGVTWQYRIPDTGAIRGANVTNFEGEPQIVITRDSGQSMAYLAVRAPNSGVYVWRSSDRFNAKWEGPFRVSPLNHTMNSHVSIVAGDAPGRIAVTYYGTRDKQEYTYRGRPIPSRADMNTVWEVFVTQSFNANAGRDEMRFLTTQINPNQDPVQVGCMSSQTAGPGGNDPLRGAGAPGVPKEDCISNLLDQVSISMDAEGRLYAAFTDSCNIRNDCIHDFSSSFQSRDRNVGVAPLDFGYSMLGDHVLLDKLALQPPLLSPKSAQETAP